MNNRIRPSAWLSAFLLTLAPLAGVVAEDETAFGSGRGVDHATVLSKSLVTLSRTYADLGFTVFPYDSYESGFESGMIYFPDLTYLELYGIHDSEAVEQGPESHAVSAPAGVTWLTLHTSSTDQTAAFLRDRGHSLFGPETIPSMRGGWLFKLTGLQGATLPGSRIYFVEYNDKLWDARRLERIEAMRAREAHRNGAQGLHAVWIAVSNLEGAAKTYEDSGFVLGDKLEMPQLRAVGRTVATGDKAILLIEPKDASSAVHSFLESRNARFMGYSIRSNSLERTKAVLAERRDVLAPEYAGRFGKSLLIPPGEAGGAWLEFFE